MGWDKQGGQGGGVLGLFKGGGVFRLWEKREALPIAEDDEGYGVFGVYVVIILFRSCKMISSERGIYLSP